MYSFFRWSCISMCCGLMACGTTGTRTPSTTSSDSGSTSSAGGDAATDATSSSDDTTAVSGTVTATGAIPGIVSVAAGGFASAGSASAPTIALANLTTLPKGFKSTGITGYTFDSSGTGIWSGTATSGATVKLKFYTRSDSSLVTIDATDSANYQLGQPLFGLTPVGLANSDFNIEVLVDVNLTFSSAYTLTSTVLSEQVQAVSANLNDSYTYTGTSGTVSNGTVTLNLTSITLVASSQGSTVTGSYAFTVTYEEADYSGTASFDADGCTGATLNDSDGNSLGTAELKSTGDLVFTATDGTTTTLSRQE